MDQGLLFPNAGETQQRDPTLHPGLWAEGWALLSTMRNVNFFCCEYTYKNQRATVETSKLILKDSLLTTLGSNKGFSQMDFYCLFEVFTIGGAD